MTAAYDGQEDIIRQKVAEVVTTFHPTLERNLPEQIPQEDLTEGDIVCDPLPKERSAAMAGV